MLAFWFWCEQPISYPSERMDVVTRLLVKDNVDVSRRR